MPSIIQQLNESLANRISDVHESLVQISNGRGAGAGTIWHADGLIITNAHVIRGHHGLNVTLTDGRKFPASVIAADDQLDLAALSINADNLPTIKTGDSRGLKAGHWVMAVGHPWGVQGAVTSGVVIGVGDQLPEMGQMQPGREWIALSLHMRPGHSGGPVIDSEGKLVGINTMITGPDVGFAIPVHVVKTFLKEAIGSKAATAI
ncbi:MAG: S1C family serine protease [Chloroflexi bacterium]|nr:S1C family serine protease [Chloroflexota bacterium]MCC6892407.1 trypsin-like peptidase domain-containing protein [Anaerolineae bacterium]